MGFEDLVLSFGYAYCGVTRSGCLYRHPLTGNVRLLIGSVYGYCSRSQTPSVRQFLAVWERIGDSWNLLEIVTHPISLRKVLEELEGYDPLLTPLSAGTCGHQSPSAGSASCHQGQRHTGGDSRVRSSLYLRRHVAG